MASLGLQKSADWGILRTARFMQRIGRGDRVFVVLSERYLCSPYCMFELFEVWRASRAEPEAFLRRVRILCSPAPASSPCSLEQGRSSCCDLLESLLGGLAIVAG